MSNVYYVQNYVVEVIQDIDAESPRKSFDNLGKMVCAHKRYYLGDEQLDTNKYNSWEEAKKDIVKDGICLDIYIYDHSGITISTKPFSSRWDSGQLGFIYVSKEDIRKEYGVKNITAKVRERVVEALQCEVETYDQYLIGDMYGFTIWSVEEEYMQYLENIKKDIEELDIEDIKEHAEEIDACWGFYGSDIFENDMIYHLGLEQDIIEELKDKYMQKSMAV